MIALLCYRIILLLLTPIIILILVFKSLKNPLYRRRLSERFGFLPQRFSSKHSSGIVVHAASVGEVIALTPLVEQLLQQYPDLPIIITTFTPTGSAQVKKQFGLRVQHCFLPLDIFLCTHFFLKRLQPQLMIFMETELWPNLISQCANKNIKLLLINGRLSENSMKSYQKISPLITPTLNYFDKILCQSEDNLNNFIKLGSNAKRCKVSGNLKFDISINATIQEKQTTLSNLLPINRPLWVMASTHQGDEEIALIAFKVIKEIYPQLLLVLVPRHPERFQSVAKFCNNQGYSVAKRSDNTSVVEQDVWLLDTLGELMAAYALSDIVTMGGSFSDIGGHNPLEPALFKKPIIVGSDMRNFKEILLQLQTNKGIMQLSTVGSNIPQQLAQAVISLLNDKESADSLGSHAYNVVLENQGASVRTLTQVQKLLESNPSCN